MVVSTIQYDVFVNVGEGLKLKFHTRDGGKHLQFVEVAQLPEGVSKAGFDFVVNKLMKMARVETERIAVAQAEAAEARAQAKEEERQRAEARQKKEAEEFARQTRRANFLQAKDTPLEVPFDDATMWFTTGVEYAALVASQVPQLQFIGHFGISKYVPGAGTVSHRAYAFLDPEHVGKSVCPSCGNASAPPSISKASGVIHRECKRCKFFSNEMPQARGGHALIGFKAAANAKV